MYELMVISATRGLTLASSNSPKIRYTVLAGSTSSLSKNDGFLTPQWLVAILTHQEVINITLPFFSSLDHYHWEKQFDQFFYLQEIVGNKLSVYVE